MTDKISNEIIRLNLGAGSTEIEGYIPIDRKLKTEVYPLDYPDGSVDIIRASHVLEHFPHGEVSRVINHWVDKLKPGGCLQIAVPDSLIVMQEYIAGNPINIQCYLMGGQIDKDDYHRVLFDAELLKEIMVNAGLERLGKWKSTINDLASLPISLNLMGFKPIYGDKIPANHGIFAAMPSARFGPIAHQKCALKAFYELTIPHEITIGCFWHQILSEVMESCLAVKSTKYILTLDYDTIFSTQDIVELYRLMQAYPEADAIAPLQSKRSCQDALFTIDDSTGQRVVRVPKSRFDRNLSEVATAHFGLTLIRADKLREFTRPWMSPKACPETGRWNEGRTDADIDFWRNWRKAGNTLFLANRVVVGHMEEMITWPDETFAPIHQFYVDYVEKGIPDGVMRA